MANIKDATINFNNVKEGAGVGLTFGGFPVRIDGLTPDLIEENGGIINAVQIDWNGAKLDNVELSVLDNKNTVNTTGQLLALINDLQEQINAIVYIMNGGNTGGDNSGSGSGDGFTSTTTTSSSTVSPTPTPTQTGR